jgi:hypothetical protein
MNDGESSHAAGLNSDHYDINSSLGAGLGGSVIAYQSPLTHEPTEGALHDPTARQRLGVRQPVAALELGDIARPTFGSPSFRARIATPRFGRLRTPKPLWRIFELRPERGSVTRSNSASQGTCDKMEAT